ncbi:MAG: hypothetical protein WDM80_07245 [Limisphaerales bacterium]
MPIALITLLDEEQQWFKSKVGMTETEISRDDHLSACWIEKITGTSGSPPA